MSTTAYNLRYKVLSSDVDPVRRLRLSRLFTLLQEAAIAHTEALGFGRKKTLDRGFLWVLALQEIQVSRLPFYDEQIILESVPGETMHTLYPRYSRILDDNGNELLNVSSIWTLIGEDDRTMAAPERTGVLIHGMDVEWKPAFPRTPKSASDDSPRSWTVPYSMTDLNGHLNNARYVDLAEDAMPAVLRARRLKRIQAEYASEIRFGESMALSAELQESCFLFSGSAGKRVFRLRFDYYAGDEKQ